MPEPSSSANPISLKTLEIVGFFGNGSKVARFRFPKPWARLLFSVKILSFSITIFATYALEKSRCARRLEVVQ